MTGTSLDALDAALVEIEGAGLAMRARFVRGVSRPLGELSIRLRHLAEQHPMRAYEIAALARDFAALHADTLRELLGTDGCDLFCVHGQTVYHAPPLSWQLMQPAALARAFGAPVVYDLRQADLAAGGQGAPITPLADAVLFRDVPGAWCVANLGGYCNVTRRERTEPGTVDPARISAADVCACNHLLDMIARTLLHASYDAEGAAALRGQVHHDALVDLEGVLNAQRSANRSLGTGDELREWVSRFRAHASPEDLCATACEALAGMIVLAAADCERLILAGGGVRNRGLVRAIESASSAPVSTSDGAGVPATYREAACFAVLGALCQDRVPITLPQVTGCTAPAPIAGCWVYPAQQRP